MKEIIAHLKEILKEKPVLGNMLKVYKAYENGQITVNECNRLFAYFLKERVEQGMANESEIKQYNEIYAA